MERSGNCDPYLDYKCLDAYLGNDFFTRFYRYYALEWGHGVAPSDPNQPAQTRAPHKGALAPLALFAKSKVRLAKKRLRCQDVQFIAFTVRLINV